MAVSAAGSFFGISLRYQRFPFHPRNFPSYPRYLGLVYYHARVAVRNRRPRILSNHLLRALSLNLLTQTLLKLTPLHRDLQHQVSPNHSRPLTNLVALQTASGCPVSCPLSSTGTQCSTICSTITACRASATDTTTATPLTLPSPSCSGPGADGLGLTCSCVCVCSHGSSAYIVGDAALIGHEC